MRFMWGFCLALGLGLLAVAVACGALAVREAAQESAYRHASACLAGAPLAASCLQVVDGSVTGVTETGGKAPDYELDVQTASETFDITFISDSAMLGYAVDGDPAVVTVWRDIPVSVEADGRTEPTATVPETAFVKYLGECGQAAGGGIFLVLGGLAIRRNRAVGVQPVTRPVVAACVTALGLGGAVVLIGGTVLAGKPSRLVPDLAVTGAVLIVVAGLSAWIGLSVTRQNRRHPARLAARGPARPAVHGPAAAQPLPPDAGRDTAMTAVPLRARLNPVRWLPVLSARGTGLAATLLTVAVLFGVLFTALDGPPARAYRHAPACAGETNLKACAGDFTAVVNGVRTPPASDANYAAVSYVTGDGAINAWAEFDGDGSVLASAARADQQGHTPLTIKVWRGAVVGAELGGAWHWAQGNPPGNTIPAVFLTVSFALLLLVTRLPIHRRGRRLPRAGRRRLIIDDLGQAAAAAAAIALLAYGFWPGAIVALAALAWLGLTAGRSRRSRRDAVLTSLRSS
jgi:hypothetical protein